MYRGFDKVRVIIAVFFLLIAKSSLFGLCKPSGFLTVDILLKADYTAMLPLKIAGVEVLSGTIPDAQSAVSSPVCVCTDPFPRVGVPVSFFEPSRIIEVVKDPYCFPTMGVGMGLSSGLQNGTAGDAHDRQRTFFQAHYYIFPLYAIIEVFTDFVCMETTGFDLAYITEVDPLWNDDGLSAIINPEAILFGNPATQLACVGDSIASQASTPLDFLFWCKGSWGNTYPLTGNTNSNNLIEDSASVAATLIYKLHRELLLWGSWGQAGLCGYYPAPIWRKSAYRMQLIAPIPHPKAMTIGTMAQMWGWGKNIVGLGDNYGYLLFKKRECCAL